VLKIIIWLSRKHISKYAGFMAPLAKKVPDPWHKMWKFLCRYKYYLERKVTTRFFTWSSNEVAFSILTQIVTESCQLHSQNFVIANIYLSTFRIFLVRQTLFQLAYKLSSKVACAVPHRKKQTWVYVWTK